VERCVRFHTSIVSAQSKKITTNVRNRRLRLSEQLPDIGEPRSFDAECDPATTVMHLARFVGCQDSLTHYSATRLARVSVEERERPQVGMQCDAISIRQQARTPSSSYHIDHARTILRNRLIHGARHIRQERNCGMRGRPASVHTTSATSAAGVA